MELYSPHEVASLLSRNRRDPLRDAAAMALGSGLLSASQPIKELL